MILQKRFCEIGALSMSGGNLLLANVKKIRYNNYKNVTKKKRNGKIKGEFHENTKKADVYDADGDADMRICHASVCIRSKNE